MMEIETEGMTQAEREALELEAVNKMLDNKKPLVSPKQTIRLTDREVRRGGGNGHRQDSKVAKGKKNNS